MRRLEEGRRDQKKSPVEEENERLLDGLIPVADGREYLGVDRIDQIDPNIMRQFADYLRIDPERGVRGEWYIDRDAWQRDQDRRAGRQGGQQVARPPRPVRVEPVVVNVQAEAERLRQEWINLQVNPPRVIIHDDIAPVPEHNWRDEEF